MMIFNINLALNNLHCRTPTDPYGNGEDEPYLWAFFIKADGSNIRQRTNDPSHLSANVTIFSGSGRPGNLNVENVTSGGDIHIPPELGIFNTNLKPIVLGVVQSGVRFRFFIPGRIVVICIAIDEDATPRDAMEGAFNDVKNLVQTNINDFLNSLDLNSMATTALANPSPGDELQSLFNQQVAKFIDDIQEKARAAAIQSAEIAVMSSWNPIEHLIVAADPDEFIGQALFNFSEKDILNINLESSLHADLRQSKTGLGGAWYILDGHLDATVSFSGLLKMQTLPEVSQPIGPPKEYIFQRDHIIGCIYKESSVQISEFSHLNKYQISVEYPFVNYRYTLDGQVLNGNKDTVVLSKEVRIPEFDENKVPLFTNYRRETRQITVQFQKIHLPNDPQIEQLHLTNDPNDGNYDLTLSIEAVLNNGRTIPVGIESIYFDGQTIKLPDDFLRNVKSCLDNFVGTRWAKSKQVTPIDLWGTVARRRQYEEVVKELDALATVGAFEKQSVEATKNIIAARLKIGQP